MNSMDMSQMWPRLTSATRTWLIDHNGGPPGADVVNGFLTVAAGERDPHWWAGDADEGGTQLTDEAIDWIDEHANGE